MLRARGRDRSSGCYACVAVGHLARNCPRADQRTCVTVAAQTNQPGGGRPSSKRIIHVIFVMRKGI